MMYVGNDGDIDFVCRIVFSSQFAQLCNLSPLQYHISTPNFQISDFDSPAIQVSNIRPQTFRALFDRYEHRVSPPFPRQKHHSILKLKLAQRQYEVM
jgi:hypothetical protein